MKDLKQIVRRLKSRLKVEDFYMYVFKDIYFKVFIQEVYYNNFFNTINLKKVIEYVYYNYFITWDNIDDVTMNIMELLLDKYLFIRCDENEPYRIQEYMIINNYYTKQSKLFNSICLKRPQFNSLINDLVQVQLSNYIIDINFIHSLLHPDSILYVFIIKEYSYDVVLDRLVNYLISNKIASRIDSITKWITKPVGIFNFPFNEKIFFADRAEWDTIDNSDIQLVYDTYIEDVDILKCVHGLEQLSNSFVEDLQLKGYLLYHR